MGCDIHCHVELKINGTWHLYGTPYLPGCYPLFAMMAGVRDDPDFGVTPISEPRGLPQDISNMTAYAHEWEGGDAHSESWLSAEEAGRVQDWYETRYPGEHHPPLFGYVFGNTVHSYLNGEQRGLNRLQDVRVVFWFDN